MDAAEKELKSFDALGVMQHDCNPEQIAEMGLENISAVPLRWVWDIKVSPSGEYLKHKARLVLCGHSGYMIRGVHYTDTFAAAPDVTTSRLLSSLA